MAAAEDVLDFLMKHGAFQPGESPWRTCEEDDWVQPVDWHRLSGSTEEQSLGEGFLDELQGILRRERSAPEEPDLQPDETLQPDFAAWYQPLHFFGPDWGIYIRDDCTERQALRMAHFLDDPQPWQSRLRELGSALLRASTAAYLLHEYYHHKVECLGIRLHVVQQAPCYGQYSASVYRKTWGTDANLEEALANAESYGRLRGSFFRTGIPDPVVKAARRYLRWEFPRSLPGYRMAPRYLSGDAFEMGESLLHCQIQEGCLAPTRWPQEWRLAPRMMQAFLPWTEHLWSVARPGQKRVLPVR